MTVVTEPAPTSPVDRGTPSEAAILTDGLTRRFGRRLALDRVNLRVMRGSTYGLIGLNGAGKTTAIRAIMGLLAPSLGRVLLRGIDVSDDPVAARTGVGYVPDRCVVHPWMRVHQAIWFCRRLQPRWNDSYCQELVKRFRIDPSQKVGKLSKGSAAKLSLILALAHDPEVLILDEPTDGLDPVARDDFLEGVLASVCEHERTVLISSHSLSDVERMADQIGLIHGGHLMIQCPTEDLVRWTKRIRAVIPDGVPTPPPPPGTILARRDGRQWVLTVKDFGPHVVDQLRIALGDATIDVDDMSLDEIFKDFVRGQESVP
jgi:ABC-2 type transport system ATP-binding protein